MAKLSRTKQAILGFLSWGPMSGYDIKRNIEGSISNFWSESFGQIYPILRQLEDQGLALCRRDETTGGRPRNVYSITNAGRDQLKEWLAEPTPPMTVRHEELLKLFFGTQTDLATNIRRIEDYLASQEGALERFESIRESLEAARQGENPSPHLPYWLMTLRYGDLEIRARVQWCHETLAELRALESQKPEGDEPSSF